VTSGKTLATDEQIMRIARSAGHVPIFESVAANCDHVDSIVAIGTREESFLSLYAIVRDMDKQRDIKRKLLESALDVLYDPKLRRKAKADAIIAKMRETLYNAENN
jgi:hypothetical protein